jgi:OOP family OmpA-OmpF porin
MRWRSASMPQIAFSMRPISNENLSRGKQTMKSARKPLYVAILTFGTMVATSASAEGGYWGIGTGQGHASVGSVTGTITSVTPNIVVTGTEGKTSDTAFKLYFGYQYTPNWGIEAGYNDLGNNFSARITATDGSTTVVGDASSKIDNWYIAATGTLPLANGLSLLGKVGAARSSVRGKDLCSGTLCVSLDTSRRTSLLVGVGTEYAFSKQWAARLEYEDYGKSSADDIWGTGNSGAIKTHSWNLSLKGSF